MSARPLACLPAHACARAQISFSVQKARVKRQRVRPHTRMRSPPPPPPIHLLFPCYYACMNTHTCVRTHKCAPGTCLSTTQQQGPVTQIPSARNHARTHARTQTNVIQERRAAPRAGDKDPIIRETATRTNSRVIKSCARNHARNRLHAPRPKTHARHWGCRSAPTSQRAQTFCTKTRARRARLKRGCNRSVAESRAPPSVVMETFLTQRSALQQHPNRQPCGIRSCTQIHTGHEAAAERPELLRGSNFPKVPHHQR